MPTKQQVQTVFNQFKEQGEYILFDNIPKAFETLNLPTDDQFVYRYVLKKSLKQEDASNEEYSRVYYQDFIGAVDILGNRPECFLAHVTAEMIMDLVRNNQEVKEMYTGVEDRGAETNVTFRMGNEQTYKNHFKFEFQKFEERKQDQPIKIQINFETKRQEEQEKIFNSLQKIIKKKKTIKYLASRFQIFGLLIEQKVHHLSSVNIQKTEKGVKLLIELNSKTINLFFGNFFQLLNQLVDTKFQVYFKTILEFNESIKRLFDTSAPYNIFDFFAKDWQLNVDARVGWILSSIKAYIIESSMVSELQYDKFYLSGLLAIALSNLQGMEGLIELNNFDTSEKQKTQIQELIVKLNGQLKQKSSDISKFLSKVAKNQEIMSIIENLGNTIKVNVDSSVFRLQAELSIIKLGDTIKKVIQILSSLQK